MKILFNKRKRMMKIAKPLTEGRVFLGRMRLRESNLLIVKV